MFYVHTIWIKFFRMFTIRGHTLTRDPPPTNPRSSSSTWTTFFGTPNLMGAFLITKCLRLLVRYSVRFQAGLKRYVDLWCRKASECSPTRNKITLNRLQKKTIMLQLVLLFAEGQNITDHIHVIIAAFWFLSEMYVHAYWVDTRAVRNGDVVWREGRVSLYVHEAPEGILWLWDLRCVVSALC